MCDQARCGDGLFSSSVHTQQTNAHPRRKLCRPTAWDRAEEARLERLARSYEHSAPPARATETHWRHGHWREQRAVISDALLRIGGGERRKRFDACGADAGVYFSPSANRHRIKAFYCGDRACEPCQRARAKRATDKLLKLIGTQPARFITLTLQADGRPLIDRLNHLHESFVNLRRQRFWKSAVRGGCAVVECTRNEETGNWHVHLHVIAVGMWLRVEQLKEGWRKASGGSYIVHIRRIRSLRQEVQYVASYVGKGFDRSCVSNADSACEALVSFKGRRLFATFGCWHNADVEEEAPGPDDWVRVGALWRIIEEAAAGQAWAKAVMLSLGRAEEEAVSTLRLDGS